MVNKALVDLLGTPDDGVGFRQGTVVAWNSSNGQNTILVAGGTLTDVPILNTSEAIALQAGHTVGLLTFNGSWFILGRITKPTDPDFASASVAFGGLGVSANNFSITTSLAIKASGTIDVPAWADEAVVLLTANATVANTSVNPFYATMQAYIDGIAGGTASFGISAANPAANNSANDLVAGACSAQRVITPGATIALDVRMSVTSGTLPASASTWANIDAIAVFRSTV